MAQSTAAHCSASSSHQAAAAVHGTGQRRNSNSRVRPQTARQGPSKGHIVILDCDKLAFGGKGVCKLDTGLVVLCEQALPGERLQARITDVKKGYAEAVRLETLRQHNNAVTPLCSHFGPCGGCSLQNLAYDAQLAQKQQQVRETLLRIAKLAEVDNFLLPIVPCNNNFGYRNKLEFSFGTQQQTHEACASWESPAAGTITNEQLVLGLQRRGHNSQVLPIDTCWLQHEDANGLLRAVAAACLDLGLQPYNPATRTGLLQRLVIRRSCGGPTGDPHLLLNFVTSGPAHHQLRPVVSLLTHPVLGQPAVTGIVNSVTASPHGKWAMRGPMQTHVLHGAGHVVEHICGLQLQVSANAFSQSNTGQAEVLFGLVKQAADLQGHEVVLDLYCGTGVIALCLARHCRSVLGLDSNADAIRDAQHNATMNGLRNAAFRLANLDQLLAASAHGIPKPDVVVADPGRTGMGPAVLQNLRASAASKLIYVSCNPATQARDVAALTAAGPGAYELVSVQACDMFPHTSHIEVVAVLRRGQQVLAN